MENYTAVFIQCCVKTIEFAVSVVFDMKFPMINASLQIVIKTWSFAQHSHKHISKTFKGKTGVYKG